MRSMLRKRLTPVGVVVMAGFVLSLLAGCVARELFPASALGSFLATWVGMLIAFVAAWFAYVVASVVSALAGYPCFVREPTSAV